MCVCVCVRVCKLIIVKHKHTKTFLSSLPVEVNGISSHTYARAVFSMQVARLGSTLATSTSSGISYLASFEAHRASTREETAENNK
jgi:hypothetical protein